MSQKRNRLKISAQFLRCPLLLSIDTYDGCLHGCRYCFAPGRYDSRNKGIKRSEPVRPALITKWKRVLNNEKIGNPMIEYLVSKKHPIQLGTNADPFPRRVEREEKNTYKFLKLCNESNYPVLIITKNTDPKDVPFDLLAQGNYILGLSIASTRVSDIKKLENNSPHPKVRMKNIPKGVFKKIIIKWHPFIPQLFMSKKKHSVRIDWGKIQNYIEKVSEIADAIMVSFLSRTLISDQRLLKEIGPDNLSKEDELEIINFIKQHTHKLGMEFYTANYFALSDSPICCGLREDEFNMSAFWVWNHLVWSLFLGEKLYIKQEDLIKAFPKALINEKFISMDIPLYSRWAKYSANKKTILDEYVKNFTTDRRMNPANFFDGFYSKVVNDEFRIYFKDYR